MAERDGPAFEVWIACLGGGSAGGSVVATMTSAGAAAPGASGRGARVALVALGGWLSLSTAAVAPGAEPHPGVRNGHALAYDAHAGRVLLFGGADEKSVLGDLWEWDGERWHLLAAEGPPPRTFPSLSYDRSRQRLVLYGGNRVLFGTGEDRNTFLRDTWEWYGGAWHRLELPTPPARAEAAMAYDVARRRLVLFGGYRGSGPDRVRFGDTWEFDGSRWVRRETAVAPSARSGAAMAYDAGRERVVLFGGSGGPSADTWEWNGADWSPVAAPAPGRFDSEMAYDTRSGVVVRFGGWDGEGRTGDTWRYDGRSWEEVRGDGPEPRNHAAMVWDERRGVLVLIGGHDGESVFGDIWERGSGTWSRVAFREPRVRVDNGH